MANVDHTEQVINLVRVLAVEIINEFKADGKFEFQHLALLLTKPEILEAFEAVVTGIATVPGEIEDLSWSEGLELSRLLYGVVSDIWAALKG